MIAPDPVPAGPAIIPDDGDAQEPDEPASVEIEDEIPYGPGMASPAPTSPGLPLSGDTSSFPELFRWVILLAILTLLVLFLPFRRKRMFGKR